VAVIIKPEASLN